MRYGGCKNCPPMADRKPCVKCGRNIDAFARVCPYCNWWQSRPVPAQTVTAPAPPPLVASFDPRTRNSILGILTFGFFLMVAFTSGALSTAPRAAPAAPPAGAQTQSPSSPRATVTLIPITEGAPPPTSIDSPITAIPPQGTTTSAGPSDLTALPSKQYA